MSLIHLCQSLQLPPRNQTVAHWAVDDIEDCVKKLVEQRATILYDTSDVGGGIKVATVVDPWGNAVGLIEGA